MKLFLISFAIILASVCIPIDAQLDLLDILGGVVTPNAAPARKPQSDVGEIIFKDDFESASYNPVPVSEPVTSSTSKANLETTTLSEKDGRDNFKAGCLPGYQKTPHDTCEKSF